MDFRYYAGRPPGKRRKRRRLKKHYRIILGTAAFLACFGLFSLLRTHAGTEPDKTSPSVSSRTGDAAAAYEKLDFAESALTAFAVHTTPDTRILSDELESQYAVLIDAGTGDVMAEKNSDVKMYPASMTKLLTLLVASEHITDTGDVFTMTRSIADYCFINKCSVVGYEVGEKIPIDELFYGCILCSGADASLALAEISAGSQDTFVDWMNVKARDLRLSDTAHFTNCVGVFDEEHCCTVRDIALIMKAVLEDDFCRTIVSTPVYMSAPTAEHPQGQVLSNWFVRRMNNQDTGGVVVEGGKTGYVPESGNCAASCGEDDGGRHYLCVTGNAGNTWKAIADHAMLYREFANRN